jgi:hypothetical protein
VSYLPAISKPVPPTVAPTATATSPTPPKCDAYEPNDDRANNPYGPLISAQPYVAKLCSGDKEDNYFFTTQTTDQLQIKLQLPASLVGKTAIYIYDQDNLSQNQDICKDKTGLVNKANTTILCSITNAGGYVVRLYTSPDTVFDNTNPYVLTATYR